MDIINAKMVIQVMVDNLQCCEYIDTRKVHMSMLMNGIQLYMSSIMLRSEHANRKRTNVDISR